MSGWICLHRKILEWEWYDDGNTFRLFMHMLLSANHKDKKWKGNTIKRGQFITGLHSLSDSLNISVQSLRTSLNRLESTGEILRKSTNKFSIITICNYNNYQDKEKEDNKQLTNNQQSTNKQLTTTNNVNNVNNKKIIVEQKKKLNGTPYKEIVDFLNSTAEKNYKHTSKATQGYIKARFNEGFTLEDFKTVIESKVKEWQFDNEMVQYIRPSTLFGTKFEGYLQASEVTKSKGIHGDWV